MPRRQIRKVNDETRRDHICAGLLEKRGRRGRRAAGCDQVIEQQYFLAPANGVFVHFHLIDAVFERVRHTNRLVRQLAALADRNESCRKTVSHGSTQNETACLDARNLVDSAIAPRSDQAFEGDLQGASIAQQGGDVAKLDSWLRVIRDRADRLAEIFALLFNHGGRV